jgi:hypothetical protein
MVKKRASNGRNKKVSEPSPSGEGFMKLTFFEGPRSRQAHPLF